MIAMTSPCGLRLCHRPDLHLAEHHHHALDRGFLPLRADASSSLCHGMCHQGSPIPTTFLSLGVHAQ
jgi:hypothetical protein